MKILLYTVKTRVCTKIEESKILIQEIEKKFLSDSGKTKRNRIRNAHIRRSQESNQEEWFRHVKRKDEHRIPKRLVEMKMNGKRPRDRP
jgi:hypothetical protein